MLLVVAGYQSMRVFKEQSKRALQTKYAEANANETLANFAKENSDKELGGFAALSTADAAYNAKDYTRALEFYNLAASALKEPILAGRAQIGQAFALYQAGQTDEGLATSSRILILGAISNKRDSSRHEMAHLGHHHHHRQHTQISVIGT